MTRVMVEGPGFYNQDGSRANTTPQPGDVVIVKFRLTNKEKNPVQVTFIFVQPSDECNIAPSVCVKVASTKRGVVDLGEFPLSDMPRRGSNVRVEPGSIMEMKVELVVGGNEYPALEVVDGCDNSLPPAISESATQAAPSTADGLDTPLEDLVAEKPGVVDRARAAVKKAIHGEDEDAPNPDWAKPWF